MTIQPVEDAIRSMSARDNELLTRVAGDAPMGRFLRENYWFPATLSQSLVAGGKPERVKLLGHRLVAFRANDGRVAIFPEACPHRRVSLALGRVEGNALKCIYHGWTFGVDGTVLATPNQPHNPEGFCKKVPLKHYPTREAAGIVWTFLGAAPTPFPEFPFMKLSGPNVSVAKQHMRFNWVQYLDGLADSAHIGVMHQDFLTNIPGNSAVADAAKDPAPVYEFQDRPGGLRFAAVRKMPGNKRYARITEFVAPGFMFISYPHGFVNLTVPADDEESTQFLIQYDVEKPVRVEAGPLDDPANWPPYPSEGPETCWGQDRAAMERGAFSGFSIHTADFVVAESQGGITERSEEFLTDSDRALIKLRRLLLDSALEFAKGTVPRIARHAEIPYDGVWVADKILAEGEDWRP